MKSRIAAIILLTCLVIPGLATCIWLQHQKAVVRKEVKRMLMAGVDRAELVQLTFSREQLRTDLQWKHSKEFAYRGQMYDIVDSLGQADSVTYWCWLDAEETRLEKQLKTLAAKAFGQDARQREKQQHLLHFYLSLFADKPCNIQLLPPVQEQLNSSAYLAHYQALITSPPAPPPQV